MTEFTIHTPETAPANSKPLLEAAKKAYGSIPNFLAVAAESPIALEAYMNLSDLAGKTSFTATELNLVWLTVNHENECHYCMAAHTGIAKGSKVEDAVIQAAREGRAQDDTKLEALRQFTLATVRERGWVSDQGVQAFFDAGYTKENLLEVITLVAHKTISNYVNHIATTPVDKAFQPFAWEKDTAGA